MKTVKSGAFAFGALAIVLYGFAMQIASAKAARARSGQAKDQTVRVETMSGVEVSLEKGLEASEPVGNPISARFGLEDGTLQLCVYTTASGAFSRVVVDCTTGLVAKVDEISYGDELMDARFQSAAMARATTTLASVTARAVRDNPGFRAAAVVYSFEDGHSVADYNQNAKDRTTCSAYLVRPLPDARVSMPLDWDEVPACEPADFTVATAPGRFAAIGDPHAGIDEAAGSLEPLLELAARDEAAGLGDAPWPPHFRKMEGERARVAPSRAKRGGPKSAALKRTKMPLVVIARSPSREEALMGLERWKARHPEVAAKLAVDDVLVDAMRAGDGRRGRGSA